MVTDNADRAPVWLTRICCSLNHGPLEVTAGVTVTPPVPPPSLTVRARVVVRVSPPPAPLMVTVAGPVAAVADALKVTMLLVPSADAGLKLAVTPEGNPLAPRATAAVKLVRAMLIVLV